MTRQNFARLFLAAAVSTLAACAANEPVKQAATAAASTSPSATAAAPAGAPGKSTPPGFGYRRMTKDGVEYFCRREGVTGSRTEKAETCQTQAQIENHPSP